MVDIRDYKTLSGIFRRYPIDSVIHLAGYKNIQESVEEPEKYYQNNINGTTNILLLMAKYKCDRIMFSSTCAVYGESAQSPVHEDDIKDCPWENPYAASKYICEGLIQNSGLRYTILRYFNPIGEYNGLRDFSKDGINSACRRALGGDIFKIYGGDYKTTDGTPERDFINIKVLVDAHIEAIRNPKFIDETANVGTGNPQSVKKLCDHLGLKYEIVGRRDGDTPSVWANTYHYEKLKAK